MGGGDGVVEVSSVRVVVAVVVGLAAEVAVVMLMRVEGVVSTSRSVWRCILILVCGGLCSSSRERDRTVIIDIYSRKE